MRILDVIRRVGRRGAFLLFLTMLDGIYAFSLFFPGEGAIGSPAYRFLSAVAPLYVWGLVWLIVGVICGVYALKQNDALGYGAAMFLKVLWATIFLLGWLFGGVERGYLATVIWGAFAAVIGLISTWPDDMKRSYGR